MENRTNQYHQNATEYRTKLKSIWESFDKKVASMERYKGSKGYAEELEKAENERDTAIMELQKEYQTKFFQVINGMKESALNRAMIPPSPEQLSVLQVLKMREKLSKDELNQAARTLAGNPAALSVLEEIAQKQNIHFTGFEMESTAGIIRHIESLEDSAKRLCALQKPDSKKEMIARKDIHSPNWQSNALYSYQVDREFTSEADTISFMGNVENLTEFQNAVNQ